MPGYGQMRRASAQQKAADGGTSDYQTDVRVYGPATDRLSESLNQGPQAQSLLQMQRALDEGPRVQSQLALQRALNRREAEPAQDDPIEASPQPASAPVQTKPNATGLPDQLKAGVEQLSGLAMDDVRVHYNSSKPAAVQAHAYAQGTDIHLAPGQEKHLPHEAWHVVQQKQGRVKPTLQLKGVAINDDAGLEREADHMGSAAASLSAAPAQRLRWPTGLTPSHAGVVQPLFYEFDPAKEGDERYIWHNESVTLNPLWAPKLDKDGNQEKRGLLGWGVWTNRGKSLIDSKRAEYEELKNTASDMTEALAHTITINSGTDRGTIQENMVQLFRVGRSVATSFRKL
ncbi:MAG: hypothetical protein QOJ86_3090 [Bradyrhizobium sp.]|jgi:hypothetical protein|nr:hypothetical protein [Bradyrhizobium sp.]